MQLPLASNSPVQHVPHNYMPENSGQWFDIPQGPDSGKKMFYYDFQLGQGIPERTILFVHGNPESSYTYAKTRDSICQYFQSQPPQHQKAVRIIAMDHIGFGLSDQASYQMIDMHHAHNLKQLVKALNLQQITLVIHDWGGAIGIGALVDEPQRVRAMVLMNTTVFPLPLTGSNYTNFPFFWLAWNHCGFVIPPSLWKWSAPLVMFSPAGKWELLKHAAHFIRRAWLGQLSQDETFYRDSLSTPMNALSSQRNVKHTRVWGHGYEYQDANLGIQSNLAFYQNIQKKVPKVWGQEGIPVRAFFGEFDPLARNKVQQQWLKALPQLQGHIRSYPDAGHFVEEVKYQDIAHGICAVTLNSFKEAL